jgi:hypothetical protein
LSRKSRGYYRRDHPVDVGGGIQLQVVIHRRLNLFGGSGLKRSDEPGCLARIRTHKIRHGTIAADKPRGLVHHRPDRFQPPAVPWPCWAFGRRTTDPPPERLPNN